MSSATENLVEENTQKLQYAHSDRIQTDKLLTTAKIMSSLPSPSLFNVVVVDLLFYVHGKHLRSCRDGQLT